MKSIKDIKITLKRALLGIGIGIAIAGSVFLWDKNKGETQREEFQSLPKQYQEKVIELRQRIDRGEKGISKGEILDNISYFNEAQGLIQFVLKGLDDIEKNEKRWDKADSAGFAIFIENAKFRNWQSHSALARASIVIDKINPKIFDKKLILNELDKAQKALDERVKLTKSRLEKK